jgi:hypothetical protein
VITTDDPDQTLGEGRIRHFASLIAATNALVKSTSRYKQIIHDDGCVARELSDREQEFVATVCGMLGYDLEASRDEPDQALRDGWMPGPRGDTRTLRRARRRRAQGQPVTERRVLQLEGVEVQPAPTAPRPSAVRIPARGRNYLRRCRRQRSSPDPNRGRRITTPLRQPHERLPAASHRNPPGARGPVIRHAAAFRRKGALGGRVDEASALASRRAAVPRWRS